MPMAADRLVGRHRHNGDEEGEVTGRTFTVAALAAAFVALGLACGCAASIDFEPSTYNPLVGQSVLFSVCESCIKDASYVFEWDLDGDGRYETETADLTVSATFAVEGYVEITLRAAGSGGDRAIATRALIVGEVPFLARRELQVQEDGALYVSVAVEVNETVNGLGIIEQIPPGWQIEIVDSGEMQDFLPGGTLNLLWLDQPVAGDTCTFSYRLYRGSAWDSPMLVGVISGFPASRPDEYVTVPLCGEIWEPEL